MIAVIKGDIIASRKLDNPEKWLIPFKELMIKWENTTLKQWDIIWGDSFQIEIARPEEVLHKAFHNKPGSILFYMV